MPNLLENATATLNELLRMRDLNQELLETLSMTMMWVRDYAEKHNIPIPRESSYLSLINKAQTLIEELTSESPQFAIRRKVTEEKSDDKVPEPEGAMLINPWTMIQCATSLRSNCAAYLDFGEKAKW